MVGRPPEPIEFRYDDCALVLESMAALATAGSGWVNLLPEVEGAEGDGGDDAPSGLAGLFRGGGPTVPMGTWVAARRGGPASVGVQHGLRVRAKARLVEHGLGPPAGWSVVQDHPRRGLVVEVPAAAAPAEVLAWLMGAVDDLCPHQLTGHWLSEVHER